MTELKAAGSPSLVEEVKELTLQAAGQTVTIDVQLKPGVTSASFKPYVSVSAWHEVPGMSGSDTGSTATSSACNLTRVKVETGKIPNEVVAVILPNQKVGMAKVVGVAQRRSHHRKRARSEKVFGSHGARLTTSAQGVKKMQAHTPFR